jgi:hypothetical protein
MLQDFVAKTASEDENLFYVFSINEDQVFCREAYESATACTRGARKIESSARAFKSSVIYARNDAVALTSVF